MSQLFYNIAGGIVHQIRREKRTTISEVIVRGKREILSKIGIGFTSIQFLLKARVSYLTTNFKTENLKLIFKGKSFCYYWVESLFVSIIVAKYNIFPRAEKGHSREKKEF